MRMKLYNSWSKLEKITISSFNIIYEVLDFIKQRMSGLLTPDIEEKIIGSAEILEIFKVSKDVKGFMRWQQFHDMTTVQWDDHPKYKTCTWNIRPVPQI